MNRFAALLDRLVYEPRRGAKLRLLTEYFKTTPDPDRGWALAALTGALTFKQAKPGIVRTLVESRMDPVLFRLSYNYVGDLAEATALIWPAPSDADLLVAAPTISHVVENLATLGKADLPGRLALWLDALDENGRWALLKLITGELRVGVSARLAKTAVAQIGDVETDEVELLWHGLSPPYKNLFAWLEGHTEKPQSSNPAPFHPPMLSHPIAPEDFATLDPSAFAAEWKWDGIRLQAVSTCNADGSWIRRIYSRTGEDVSYAFPDILEALHFEGAIDGELLVVREGRVQSFNILQQRLNRKTVTPKLIAEFPAHLRAYDLLVEGSEDVRALSFTERRSKLEKLVARIDDSRIDLSPVVPFDTWEELAAARADPAQVGAGLDAQAIEGCMLKRVESPYLPGRPKGHWYKWKRDPFLVDTVMMYGQRGHGKRSSFYSDYTFGVWRESEHGEDELVPVGKAYHGFTDEELLQLDRYVRNHTVNRFGPVREVDYGKDRGLVLEVAFEGLQRSTRHKSGIAMRFPRINRIRWDKPSLEADRIETLEKLLDRMRGDDLSLNDLQQDSIDK